MDGSPWIGNIDLYLDTDATRSIGVMPGSCGHAKYTRDQLAEIVGAFYPKGWQMACHVQGDAGVDTILDVYEDARAAYQLFAEDRVGSIEVGKYADLVVLSADPSAVGPEEVANLTVRATYLAGRQVYPKPA